MLTKSVNHALSTHYRRNRALQNPHAERDSPYCSRPPHNARAKELREYTRRDYEVQGSEELRSFLSIQLQKY
jgi:hypothetical protein